MHITGRLPGNRQCKLLYLRDRRLVVRGHSCAQLDLARGSTIRKEAASTHLTCKVVDLYPPPFGSNKHISCSDWQNARGLTGSKVEKTDSSGYKSVNNSQVENQNPKSKSQPRFPDQKAMGLKYIQQYDVHQTVTLQACQDRTLIGRLKREKKKKKKEKAEEKSKRSEGKKDEQRKRSAHKPSSQHRIHHPPSLNKPPVVCP